MLNTFDARKGSLLTLGGLGGVPECVDDHEAGTSKGYSNSEHNSMALVGRVQFGFAVEASPLRFRHSLRGPARIHYLRRCSLAASRDAAALTLATCTTAKLPPSAVAQSSPALAAQNGQSSLMGLVGRTGISGSLGLAFATVALSSSERKPQSKVPESWSEPP